MKIYEKERPQTIRKMFASIAPNYDRGNAVLSFNLHRYWNNTLAKMIVQSRKSPANDYLDLCSGTGDIAIAYKKLLSSQNTKHPNYTLLDFCPEMLQIAKSKWGQTAATFIAADAQQIPIENASVDHITVAYGVRNIASPVECFEEVFRILRPKGAFAILELTRPKNSILRLLHSIYLKTCIPTLGRLVATDKDAYNYLKGSIGKFATPNTLQLLLKKIGFSRIELKPLSGGIATIITAHK